MLSFDRRVSGYLADGSARVVFVDATASAIELAARHQLEGAAVALASELLVANVLLGAWIKGDERVSLQLQSPAGVSFLGEADAEGRVRGKLSPTSIERDDTVIDGILLAIKHDGQQEMYRGVTQVEHERVGEALQRHVSTSDQVGARIRIEATPDGRALGLLVEPLPVSAEQSNLAAGREVAVEVMGEDWDALAAGLDIGEFGGHPFELLEVRAIAFNCHCSRERVEAMLRSLGAAELASMIEDDHGATVTCTLCAQEYVFDEPELRVLCSGLDPDQPAGEA